jgi:hypothetical protein
MNALMVPMTRHSPKSGWAHWVHWETSGAHFYAWEVPQLFFSVAIYTCKAFRDEDAVESPGRCSTRKSSNTTASDRRRPCSSYWAAVCVRRGSFQFGRTK